jgi:hypothetical protein
MKRAALAIGPHPELNDAICKRLAKLDYEASAVFGEETSQQRCGDKLQTPASVLEEMEGNSKPMDVCICHAAMPFELLEIIAMRMAQRGWGRIVEIALVDEEPDAIELGDERVKELASQLQSSGVTINTIVTSNIGAKAGESCSAEQTSSRLSKIEEIAGLAAYLASDEADFISGARIAFDTGRRMN